MLVPQVATSKFVGDALIESFFDCARVCVCAHAYVKYMSKLLAALTGHTDRQSVSYLAAHRAVRSSQRRRRRRRSSHCIITVRWFRCCRRRRRRTNILIKCEASSATEN